MQFVPIAMLAATVKKVMDFLKAVTNGDKNGYVTILITWAAGVGITLLAAQTDFEFPVGDFLLGDLNVYSQIFVGMNVASLGATLLYDVPKRLDSTSKTPNYHLLPRAPKRRGSDT